MYDQSLHIRQKIYVVKLNMYCAAPSHCIVVVAQLKVTCCPLKINQRSNGNDVRVTQSDLTLIGGAAWFNFGLVGWLECVCVCVGGGGGYVIL